jgi:hypothetical protein
MPLSTHTSIKHYLRSTNYCKSIGDFKNLQDLRTSPIVIGLCGSQAFSWSLMSRSILQNAGLLRWRTTQAICLSGSTASFGSTSVQRFTHGITIHHIGTNSAHGMTLFEIFCPPSRVSRRRYDFTLVRRDGVTSIPQTIATLRSSNRCLVESELQIRNSLRALIKGRRYLRKPLLPSVRSASARNQLTPPRPRFRFPYKVMHPAPPDTFHIALRLTDYLAAFVKAVPRVRIPVDVGRRFHSMWAPDSV